MTSETTIPADTEQQADAADQAPAIAPEAVPAEARQQARSTADIANAGSAGAAQPQPSTPEASPAAKPTTAPSANTEAPLFDEASAASLRERWLTIQTDFVDEPRGAVEKADTLVAEVMTQLAESFAQERKNIEGRLSDNRETSTEDLRQAIRRYRSFFNRLLAV
jgi:hypothetical protein